MKIQDLQNYTTAKGMNFVLMTDEFGDKYAGIEWKNKHVWYLFLELDFGLVFTERYSQNTGRKQGPGVRTAWRAAWKIEQAVEKFTKG
jgi:hypothetical protein